MKRTIGLIIIILAVISGCKKKTENNDYVKIVDTIKVNTLDTELTKGIQMEKKPVEITGPSVVFFMPDYKERQQIIRFYGETNRYDFEHIFSNFRRLALDARQSLSPYGINSFLTYSWQFNIKTDSGYIHFDRKAQNEIVGFIIADGHKPPVIKFGLYKYVDFQQLIKDYFEILDFKMLSEPKHYKALKLPKLNEQPDNTAN